MANLNQVLWTFVHTHYLHPFKPFKAISGWWKFYFARHSKTFKKNWTFFFSNCNLQQSLEDVTFKKNTNQEILGLLLEICFFLMAILTLCMRRLVLYGSHFRLCTSKAFWTVFEWYLFSMEGRPWGILKKNGDNSVDHVELDLVWFCRQKLQLVSSHPFSSLLMGSLCFNF